MFAIRKAFFGIGILAVLLLSTACANFYKAHNQPTNGYVLKDSYRVEHFSEVHSLGDNLIILAFSGGGTRASALSYGVMQELRDTYFDNSKGERASLLSDVDYISAVSGGSFTAAYYAAFGDRLFIDFERAFLRQSIEGALLSKLLSPRHWFKSLWSGFDRTEMAIEYYDKHVFEGATFADIPLGKRPFVLINATDLSQGVRFSFDQDTFDWICSDLSSVSLARAVTASSAVPVAFPSVVFKNHGGSCDLEGSPNVALFKSLREDKILQRNYRSAINRLSNSDERPYLHLVDGGISDNLGLRAVSDQLELYGADNDEQLHIRPEKKSFRRVILILVNSAVRPSRAMDQSPDSPPVFDTIDAVSSALIQHYDEETRAYFFDQASEFKLRLSEVNPEVEFFLAEVSFQDISDNRQRNFFNSLPTSLELKEAQIDAIIAAGRSLLRNDRAFIALKKSLNASLPASYEASNYELEKQLRMAPLLNRE